VKILGVISCAFLLSSIACAGDITFSEPVTANSHECSGMSGQLLQEGYAYMGVHFGSMFGGAYGGGLTDGVLRFNIDDETQCDNPATSSPSDAHGFAQGPESVTFDFDVDQFEMIARAVDETDSLGISVGGVFDDSVKNVWVPAVKGGWITVKFSGLIRAGQAIYLQAGSFGKHYESGDARWEITEISWHAVSEPVPGANAHLSKSRSPSQR